jgi:DNA-binding transcriptional ArsR family regulator
LSERRNVKAHLEFGDLKADFEGDADQVFESILRFLSQVCPAIELLQKIVYIPDLIDLMKTLSGVVEITPDGPAITLSVNLPTKSSVCLALLGAYVGNKIGKLQKDTLSISELSMLTGKAKKTISNEIPSLVENGLVEKASEGEYRITQLGIRKTKEIAEAVKQSKV